MAPAACCSRDHAQGRACTIVSCSQCAICLPACPLPRSIDCFVSRTAFCCCSYGHCVPCWKFNAFFRAQGREKLERTRDGKIAAFLWKTLWARHKGTLMVSLALQGVYSAFNFAGPVILNKIVTFLQNWALWKAEQNAPLVRVHPAIVSRQNFAPTVGATPSDV